MDTPKPSVTETPADSGLETTAKAIDKTHVSVRPANDAALPQSNATATKPAVGSTVGRFFLLEQLGAGGMGVVWVAYDPRLDRKVALKFLRAEMAEDMVAWMLREAQALARVNHPNVIAVHDVGNSGGTVYIAQEFVRGKDLESWLKDEPRPLQQILSVFLQAARGLAAAHAAGIVHRDFKPANVLLGDDGRARVLDFGLARLAQDPARLAETLPNNSSTPADTGLTAPGAIMGTPLYMSPEQHRGETANAQSDQYSFCVSLYRALYGKPPFEGADYAALRESVLRGKTRETLVSNSSMPRSARVPAWVRAVLARGLEKKAEDRFPSMDALIAALSADPSVGRIRKAIAAGAISLVLLAALIGARTVRSQRQMCKGAERKLASIWDASRRSAVENAFRATQLPYAESSLGRVEQLLDGYSSDWVAMHTTACEATRIHGEQSEEVLDLRMTCLGQRLQEIKASTDLFVSADKQVVEKAIQVAEGLTPISGCADIEALKAPMRPPKDEEARKHVEQVRAQLARARVLENGGQISSAVKEAGTALSSARLIDYPPLRAEALKASGELHVLVRQDALAEQELEEAVFVAEGCHHDQVAADAMIELERLEGVTQEHFQLAHLWGHLAEAVIRRGNTGPLEPSLLHRSNGEVLDSEDKSPEALVELKEALAGEEKQLGPDALELAWTHKAIGSVYENQGNYDDALRERRQSLALVEKNLGKDHPEAAHLHARIGNTLDSAGKYDEALAEETLTLETQTKTFGPESPVLIPSLNILGITLWHKGRNEEALAILRRAAAIADKDVGTDSADAKRVLVNIANVLQSLGRYPEAEAVLRKVLAECLQRVGADHPEVADAMSNLADTLDSEGKHDESLAMMRKALAIRQAALGPDHPDVGASHNNIGDVLREQGKFEESLAEFKLALEIKLKRLKPDNPLVANSYNNIGEVLIAEGKYKEGLEACQTALSIREKALGREHPDTATTVGDMGVAHLGLGEYPQAIAALTQALTVLESKAEEPETPPAFEFALAKALWGAGRDRRKALENAHKARTRYAQLTDHAPDVAQIDRWLASHPVRL
jgi:tetratricopeptide (TPR) repeat protein